MKHYLKLIGFLLVATLVFQGFQCSSREMTTAKVAMQNGDNAKAIENLQTEIEKNPKNAEAYILLAELKSKQGDIAAATALMDKAEPLVANNPKLKDRPAQFKFNAFKQSIDNGQSAFNKYTNNKNSSQLETAIKHFTTALMLRPYFYDGHRMLGLANDLLDKQEEAATAYSEYARIIQPAIDVAVKNKFYIGEQTKNVYKTLGNPIFIRGFKDAVGDSTILDKFVVGGKDLYMMSSMKAGNEPKVVSWSYDPPQNILQGEREIVPSALAEPLNSLASIYYKKKDFANSLKYFNLVSSIDPTNENANSAIVTLYQEMGKPEDAVNAINENIKKNPDNYVFIAQLGDVYMGREDYDKAILQYEKALEKNPTFEAALRNVAACYGNKAAKIQTEQVNLQKEGKIKQIDPNTYLPTLNSAAEYFTRCLATPGFKDDTDVLGDLCGIYLAMLPKEQSKFDKAMSQLEALESKVPKEKKEAYYLKLLKIYGQTKNPKLSEIEKKINEL